MRWPTARGEWDLPWIILQQMYCSSCHHDLRGLRGEHCPACGRWFAPDRPDTFDRSPGPQRLHAILRQASDLLAEAMLAVEPAEPAAEPTVDTVTEPMLGHAVDPVSRAIAALRRQVGRVSAENWELRQQLAALTQVLLDRELVDATALAAATERVAAMAEVPPVVDGDDEAMIDEEADLLTPELLDLRRAVDDHALGD